jgi:hypothetical protein
MADETGTGAESAPEGAAAEGGEAGDITAPPASNTWWQFGTQGDAESWANELVTKRLARQKKSQLDPVVQERDTLRAQVQELLPLKEATQTDTERWESKFNAQAEELNSLRESQSKSQRDNLVRQIADEEGLPASFLARVSGGDEDEIREDIKSVLNALSEGGFNPGKKTPATKNPKPAGSGGGSVGSGGGSDTDEPDDEALTKSILEQARRQRKFGGLVTTRR